jgi:hypothetical protein
MVVFIVNRDHGKCGICGHWAAHSADHIVPVTEDPGREWDTTNLVAAHAWPKACPDCSIAAGKPIYCNSIKGMGSMERVRRLLEKRTGLTLPVGEQAPYRPEGRDLWLYRHPDDS